VQLSGAEIDAAEAIRVASQIGASFISVRAAPFNLNAVLDELVEDETHSAESVQRLKMSAQPHDGAVESVTVTWAAQGLLHEWSATTVWGASFLDNLFAVVQEAEAEAEAAQEDSLEEYYSNYRAAVTALAESPRYRGEQVGKRRYVAPSIIAEAGLEEIPEVILTRQIMAAANKILNAKAYEFEQDFRTRKTELADELRSDSAWCRVYTKLKRKDAAIKFLMKKANGYRLSADLAEEISEAAAIPEYVSRY
jgi:hypothetical protein